MSSQTDPKESTTISLAWRPEPILSMSPIISALFAGDLQAVVPQLQKLVHQFE